MQKDFTQDMHTFTHLVLGSINLTLRLKYQNGVYAAVNLVEPIDNRGPIPCSSFPHRSNFAYASDGEKEKGNASNWKVRLVRDDIHLMIKLLD